MSFLEHFPTPTQFLLEDAPMATENEAPEEEEKGEETVEQIEEEEERDQEEETPLELNSWPQMDETDVKELLREIVGAKFANQVRRRISLIN